MTEKTVIGNTSGANTGEPNFFNWYSDTKANFNTALSDGSFAFSGDAPTAHTHELAAGATDITATAAELNILDLSGTALTAGWGYFADAVSTATWRQLLGSEINNDAGWTGATDITGKADVDQTMYIGTTAVAINRASATLNLAGIGTFNTHTIPGGTGTLALTSDITGTNSGTNTGDEVKATGAEVDTGTDDVKYVTPKAIKDSHNVPSVAPSTDGKVLTSNGTDWVSETPAGDSTKLPLAGGTMSGDIQLGETDIKLDAVLSGDEKWSGITMAGTAGATLAVGDICFLQTADSKWELVDGILDGTDLGFKLQLGICTLAASAEGATEMLVYGKVRSAAFPAFTVGAPVYLDDTAGDLVCTQPSTTNFAIRKVGYALSSTDLFFSPSPDYIVHT